MSNIRFPIVLLAAALRKLTYARLRWLLGSLLCAICPIGQAAVSMQPTSPIHFAVIGNMPFGDAAEPAGQALLSAIANTSQAEFVLDTGNFKQAIERCTDTLLSQRIQWLDRSSPLPLILLPGANDWVNCQLPQAGGYDPLERLDFLRTHFFDKNVSLGQKTLALQREGNVTRLTQFTENVMWREGSVLFIGLNVSSAGNHYVTGGGRNGEFEDRVTANRYWLNYALRASQQTPTRAIVVAIEGDPHWNRSGTRRWRHWLNFGDIGFNQIAQPDAYREFRQHLLEFAHRFGKPVLLINQAHLEPAIHRNKRWPDWPRTRHTVSTPAPLFRLIPVAQNKKAKVRNPIWQLQINAHPDLYHWIDVEIMPSIVPIFRVSIRSMGSD